MRDLVSVALFSVLVTLAGVGGNQVLAEEPMTIAQEQGLGAREHPRILQRFGGEYPNVPLRLYVADVGARLVRTLPSTPYDFLFTLLDAPDAYAFAMPGGYVYVTRQMVALANTEAELAAVLAHEIAHVVSRHARQRQAMQDDLRGGPAAENIEAMHRFTRDQEFDADALSIQLLADAGYDPMAQARFLATIGAQQELEQRAGSPRPRDAASHPAIEARVIRATEAARAVTKAVQAKVDATDGLLAGYLPLAAREVVWDEGRDKYLGMIDGLVYGRRPNEGMVVGNTYIDTYSRYTFTLPAGFHFTGTGRTITARGPNGASMRFDSQLLRSPQTEPLTTYLSRSISGGFTLEMLEEGTIGGMSAAFARASLRGSGGRPAIVQFTAIRVTPTTYFRFQFYLPEASPTMAEQSWQSPASLRRLSPEEAAAVQPMRVRVLTAEPETEIEGFAAQMRALDHPLEWLMMLNHLAPGADPAAGSKFKIVQ